MGESVAVVHSGIVHSVDPPETDFGFTVWSHMIPPFRPESSLILGYGGGTAAALMRKIWGPSLKITGVDRTKYDWKYVEHKMKVGDAFAFVKDCVEGFFKQKFDFVCVDVWDVDRVPSFIFEPEFAVYLKEICTRMVCINVRTEDLSRVKAMMIDYGGFTFKRGDVVQGNIVLWWSK